MKNFKSVSVLSTRLNDSVEILRQCALNPTFSDSIRLEAQRSLSLLLDYASRLASQLPSLVVPSHLKHF